MALAIGALVFCLWIVSLVQKPDPFDRDREMHQLVSLLFDVCLLSKALGSNPTCVHCWPNKLAGIQMNLVSHKT